MSTYREIHGKAVKSLDTDPSATTDAGQIWYNTASNTFKSIVNLEAWSSASPMSTARARAGGTTSSDSTQSAGLAFGGQDPGGVVNLTEEYNGAGWSTGGALGTARRWHYGAGSQTAALCAGGVAAAGATPVTANSEEYNGSSWTEGENMGTGRYNGGSGGTQTAAFAVGGSPAPSYTNATEEYDGTDWTAGNNMLVSKGYYGGGGTLTAGIIMGIGASSTDSYHYDGTNWTAGGTMNRGASQGSYAGLQTDGISFGGTPPTTATEHYNGTTWTNYPAMGTARYALAGASGTASAAMGSGGEVTPQTNVTEEFNNTANIITAAAWSSGTNFPTTSSAVAGAGPRDAAIGIGGYPAGSPPTGKSFEYDGTSWSAEATLNSNTGTLGVNAATGTQTAVINAQNGPGPAPPYVYSAAGEYDGSSWSNANNRPGDNYSNAMAGTQTAGLIFGGTSSPTGTMDATFSYDGTNWTAEEAMNTARSEIAGSGTATAALGSAGYSNPPGTVYANTEEYGGESWTASNALLYVVRNGRSSGTQTDAIYMGGGTPSLPLGIVNCLTYDGTSWATAPSMATSRQNQGNGATSPVGAAWGAAGYSAPGSPNRTNTTEHFNVETTAINVKTLTQS